MSEHARDVAVAFFGLFLDASKRTAEDSSAFVVYAADSIARITRAKADGNTEDVTLNGIDSIAMYNLSLPPSVLTLVHYDALPTHGDGIAIMASGTETIDITNYQWSRTLVLSPTPQGGFYLKSDMLHYDVGVQLEAVTTEVIETVMVPAEPKVVQKKARVQNLRDKKPRAQRTPLGAASTEESITTPVAPAEEAAPVVQAPAPVVQAPVVEAPVVVVVPVVEPEPVVIVQPTPSPVIPAPTPAPVVETPQNSTQSWSQMLGGNKSTTTTAAVVEPESTTTRPVRQQRQKRDAVPEPEVEVAPVAEVVAEVKPVEKKQFTPASHQVNVNGIPEVTVSTFKDDLMMALVQYGDVTDIYLPAGKKFAIVSFKTAQDATAAANVRNVKVGKVDLTLTPKVVKDEGFRAVPRRK